MSAESGLNDSDLEPTEQLRHVGDALEFPQSATDFALAVYSQAIENELFRGRTKEDVLAASLYIGGKNEGVPIQAGEIAELTDSDERSILSTRRHLDNRLELNLPPANPRAYVHRFCDELETESDLRDVAMEIVEACKEQNLNSGSPSGFAAGAVYAASVLDGSDLTQQEVSSVSSVSEVTIRNWYSDQIEAYHQRSEEQEDESDEPNDNDTSVQA